jgi:gamma-glutamyltranspeptidase/glutathione hydrolase
MPRQPMITGARHMSLQEAVEAPRFVTHSFPGSFEPHPYSPGRLDLERGVGAATGEALAARAMGW